jgi:copper homeostasis protein
MGTSTHLEIALFGTASLVTALASGATRIELNAANSYISAGTTPDEATVRDAVSTLDSWTKSHDTIIPLRVMIRPTSRDFIYTSAEIAMMVESITTLGHCFRPGNGDGVVFGVLRDDEGMLSVDELANSRLVRLASAMGLRCVFHRACDGILGDRARGTLEAIKRCGFDGVLTAGGSNGNAVDQVEILTEIGGITAELALELIVGGGVRMGNISTLTRTVSRRTGRLWFHSACLMVGQEGRERIDEKEVRGIRECLQSQCACKPP